MDNAVFVDSDVIISALISKTGAAFRLMRKAEAKRYVSDVSLKEQRRVVKRIGLDMDELKKMIEDCFQTVELNKNQVKNFQKHVRDVDDTHVVAGAVEAKVKFLITYNLKHFRIDKIKADLNILVTTPANFLQYLRSLERNS